MMMETVCDATHDNCKGNQDDDNDDDDNDNDTEEEKINT